MIFVNIITPFESLERLYVKMALGNAVKDGVVILMELNAQRNNEITWRALFGSVFFYSLSIPYSYKLY